MKKRPISERIFAWLGQYRDSLPDEAVASMQENDRPLHTDTEDEQCSAYW